MATWPSLLVRPVCSRLHRSGLWRRAHLPSRNQDQKQSLPRSFHATSPQSVPEDLLPLVCSWSNSPSLDLTQSWPRAYRTSLCWQMKNRSPSGPSKTQPDQGWASAELSQNDHQKLASSRSEQSTYPSRLDPLRSSDELSYSDPALDLPTSTHDPPSN